MGRHSVPRPTQPPLLARHPAVIFGYASVPICAFVGYLLADGDIPRASLALSVPASILLVAYDEALSARRRAQRRLP